MKILRLFESKYNTDFFQNSKLDNFLEEEREFKEKKENMLNLINEYIDLNIDYFSDEYDINRINDFLVEEINLGPNDRLALKVIEGNWFRYFRNEDFKKLIEFINNPDLLRNQKKYNI